MLKYLVAIVSTVAFLSLYGCSKDCEVCMTVDGEKSCTTDKDVKKSDCEDCNSKSGKIAKESIEYAKALGLDVGSYSCSAK